MSRRKKRPKRQDPASGHRGRVTGPVARIRQERQGIGALFGDDLPEELTAGLTGLDDDVVRERGLLWRAFTARGSGLDPDRAAEAELVDRVEHSDLIAARSPGVWAGMLAMLVDRAGDTAAADRPALVEEAAASGREPVLAIVDQLEQLAADPAELVTTTAAAAGWLSSSISTSEARDETPGTVAAWAIAELFGNLDVWAAAIADAAAAGRSDVAAAGLGGLIASFEPDSEPIRQLGGWLTSIARTAGDVPASTVVGDVVPVRADLQAAPSAVAELAAAHGWVPVSWAVGGYVVDAAGALAGQRGAPVDSTVRSLLARWPLLTEAIA